MIFLDILPEVLVLVSVYYFTDLLYLVYSHLQVLCRERVDFLNLDGLSLVLQP